MCRNNYQHVCAHTKEPTCVQAYKRAQDAASKCSCSKATFPNLHFFEYIFIYIYIYIYTRTHAHTYRMCLRTSTQIKNRNEEREREKRIIFITHLKPLQPETAINDDCVKQANRQTSSAPSSKDWRF
jgi:hypothetical protein